MPFDDIPGRVPVPDPGLPARQRACRGRRAQLGGRAAEEAVARHYAAQGSEIVRQRWRGRAGEVDMILREGDRVVFVEVKSGPDFDRALARIGPRQIARIFAAAEEFVADEPRGGLTDIRIDLALVDGSGRVRVMENAFAWL